MCFDDDPQGAGDSDAVVQSREELLTGCGARDPGSYKGSFKGPFTGIYGDSIRV